MSLTQLQADEAKAAIQSLVPVGAPSYVPLFRTPDYTGKTIDQVLFGLDVVLPSALSITTQTLYKGAPVLEGVIKANTQGGPEVRYGLPAGLTAIWFLQLRRSTPPYNPGDPLIQTPSAGVKRGAIAWREYDDRCTHEVVGHVHQVGLGAKTRTANQFGTHPQGFFVLPEVISAELGQWPTNGTEYTDALWYRDLLFLDYRLYPKIRLLLWARPDDGSPFGSPLAWSESTVATGAEKPTPSTVASMFHHNQVALTDQKQQVAYAEVVDGVRYVNPFNVVLP